MMHRSLFWALALCLALGGANAAAQQAPATSAVADTFTDATGRISLRIGPEWRQRPPSPPNVLELELPGEPHARAGCWLSRGAAPNFFGLVTQDAMNKKTAERVAPTAREIATSGKLLAADVVMRGGVAIVRREFEMQPPRGPFRPKEMQFAIRSARGVQLWQLYCLASDRNDPADRAVIDALMDGLQIAPGD